MEAAAFDAWLGLITRLTDTQRRRVLEAMAPSDEAEASDRQRTVPEPGGLDPTVGSSPPAPAADLSSVADVCSIGQHKVAVTGCPHYGGSDMVHWGKASGLPRYRCKACARTFNALTKSYVRTWVMAD